MKTKKINPTRENNEKLRKLGSTELKKSLSFYELLKRPEIRYDDLKEFSYETNNLRKDIRLLVETEIKYEGYIKKQEIQIEKYKKLENKKLDVDDYSKIKGLKKEAVDKLNKMRPDSVGQASRISGVSPADVNVLLVYLEVERRQKNDSK